MFTTAYAALYPEKVNTLVLTITPIDFHADTVENREGHGFINVWTRSLEPEDVDRLIEANGNLPGEFMGAVFNLMTPMRSMMKYNWDMLEVVDDEKRLLNWLRMEKWIADRPDHPGEAAKQWLKDLYQQNKLVKNEWELDGRRVDLGNITMPVLNVYAKDDHIIPPATSRALGGKVASSDYKELALAGRACRRIRGRQVAEAVRARGIGGVLAADTTVQRDRHEEQDRLAGRGRGHHPARRHRLRRRLRRHRHAGRAADRDREAAFARPASRGT